ncbi:hypothetical protein LTR60_007581, partial [Cryomyces antarcticus]
MLTLPTELETPVLSMFGRAGQATVDPKFGESSIMEFIEAFREGIIMPFCVIVGEESGDDCSAMVEWWRFVQAREKSMPLEWRGRDVAGDP